MDEWNIHIKIIIIIILKWKHNVLEKLSLFVSKQIQ